MDEASVCPRSLARRLWEHWVQARRGPESPRHPISFVARAARHPRPAVRDPVANDPHRRRCGGPRRKRPRTQPQRAEQAWRRELVQADEIYRSEEHTSELQSLMRISYAVFCLKKKNVNNKKRTK